MQMILGITFAAIFVWIGISLEPGGTTLATITTRTYSLGVVGINGLIMPVLGIGTVWFVLKSMKNEG